MEKCPICGNENLETTTGIPWMRRSAYCGNCKIEIPRDEEQMQTLNCEHTQEAISAELKRLSPKSMTFIARIVDDNIVYRDDWDNLYILVGSTEEKLKSLV